MITPIELLWGTITCCGILAVGAVLRARRTIADWAFVAGIVLMALEGVCTAVAARLHSADDIVALHQWRLVVDSLLPGTWFLFSITFARGNAGQFLRRWRAAIVISFLVPLVAALGFRPQLVDAAGYAADSGRVVLHLGWSGFVLLVCVLVGSVAIVMNLERTFRASVGTMRWRIKFMLLGVGLIFVVRIYTASQELLFRVLDPSLDSINVAGLIVATILIVRSFLRVGRFDTGVYPSLTVLHSSLTILLAGVYLLFVGVVAKVVSHFGGDAGFAIQATFVLVSVAALAVLLQSDRVRLHLGRFLSRHFQRPLYDYRTVWRRFTEDTASKFEPGELSRSLVRIIADIFESLSVSIWMLDDKKETFILGSSTSVSEAKAQALAPTLAETHDVISFFQKHGEPVDVDVAREPWAAAIRRWHPSEFVNGGDRISAPMIARGEVIGMIIVGDRVSGIPFSMQDFDMLKCVADQAAASMLSLQLSRKLVEAKELEAFQTMAAFFVHDLKNAASTLNLMLQNLPVHFDDPEFRQDALRGIGKTVNHINRLTGRLSMLRHELKIQPSSRDLNEVVASALAELEPASPAPIEKQLRPVARTLIDSEQLHKVITNLVLNATEALSGEGTVRIETGQNNGWVVLSVSDTGCGMTEDFIRRSLFRPFQTTKQHGLGIGMFQTKMIVEAHGGRMAVSSQVGKGTTFQVLLPVRSPSA